MSLVRSSGPSKKLFDTLVDEFLPPVSFELIALLVRLFVRSLVGLLHSTLFPPSSWWNLKCTIIARWIKSWCYQSNSKTLNTLSHSDSIMAQWFNWSLLCSHLTWYPLNLIFSLDCELELLSWPSSCPRWFITKTNFSWIRFVDFRWWKLDPRFPEANFLLLTLVSLFSLVLFSSLYRFVPCVIGPWYELACISTNLH